MTTLAAKIQSGEDLGKDDLALLNSLVEMQEAPEPEPEDKIVHRGDERNPAPMARTETKSAGYVYLRRASDGKLKEINRNQLADRLKQKLDDGSPAWLPPNAPWKGKVRKPDTLCLLNAEHPQRKRMDELNLEVCKKRGKLMGVGGMRVHMQKKHKDAWATIQLDQEHQREDAREAREAKRDEALLAILSGKQVASQVVPMQDPVEVTVECDICGLPFTAKAKFGAMSKIKAHKRQAHGG